MKRWMVVAAWDWRLRADRHAGCGARRAACLVRGLPGGCHRVVNRHAAISKNNVWAVGETYTKAGKPVYQPFIRHFNGSSWQVVTIPGSAGSAIPGCQHRRRTTSGSAGTRAAARPPLPWRVPVERRPLGKGPDARDGGIRSVAVLGPNNVWAFGMSSAVFVRRLPLERLQVAGLPPRQHQLHPAGASPRQRPITSGCPDTRTRGSSRWWPPTAGTARAWHAVSMPHPALDDGARSHGGVGLQRLDRLVRSTAESPPHALHWDGHHWRTVTVPYYADTTDIVPDGKGGYWFGAQAILTGSTWTSRGGPRLHRRLQRRDPDTGHHVLPAGRRGGDRQLFNPRSQRSSGSTSSRLAPGSALEPVDKGFHVAANLAGLGSRRWPPQRGVGGWPVW